MSVNVKYAINRNRNQVFVIIYLLSNNEIFSVLHNSDKLYHFLATKKLHVHVPLFSQTPFYVYSSQIRISIFKRNFKKCYTFYCVYITVLQLFKTSNWKPHRRQILENFTTLFSQIFKAPKLETLVDVLKLSKKSRHLQKNNRGLAPNPVN